MKNPVEAFYYVSLGIILGAILSLTIGNIQWNMNWTDGSAPVVTPSLVFHDQAFSKSDVGYPAMGVVVGTEGGYIRVTTYDYSAIMIDQATGRVLAKCE